LKKLETLILQHGTNSSTVTGSMPLWTLLQGFLSGFRQHSDESSFSVRDVPSRKYTKVYDGKKTPEPNALVPTMFLAT
jgi:hypothetical protein